MAKHADSSLSMCWGCRYELSMDFAQALEHAQSSSNTKVMLRFADVGVTY